VWGSGYLPGFTILDAGYSIPDFRCSSLV